MPATFNLSAAAVEEQLKQSPVGASRIAAVMPVHLYGQCAEMDAFAALAQRYELKVVEDAAQAFGASWNGVRAGGLGDAAAFSFYPTKNLSAMGDAGMVTTRSAETDERVRMLRTHGMRRRYFHDEIGWNARMDAIQAAVLEVKLKRVEAGNARRREIAALYDRLFRDAGLAARSVAEGIVLPWTDPRAEHVFHQYVIRAPRRDAVAGVSREEGIGSEIYYPLPLHLQESLAFLGYRKGDFPESERAADEVLALPIYPELREDEVETVVDAVRRFYAWSGIPLPIPFFAQSLDIAIVSGGPIVQSLDSKGVDCKVSGFRGRCGSHVVSFKDTKAATRAAFRNLLFLF